MRSTNLRLTAMASALMLATGLPATAWSQSDGAIQGRVTDASGQFPVADAEIIVEGQAQRAQTGRDGSFRLGNLAPGQYTLIIRYVGAEPQAAIVTVADGATQSVEVRLGADDALSDDDTQTILVVGQAARQSAAINRERNAINNVEVLSADALGNFPDENVAEALQRVPGLSIQRDQGEGRFVAIRGLNADFNTTTVNGLRVPAPGNDTRAVNLDIVSSDLVQSVVVTKSVTPDMDADAVGGNIEITTLTALDLGNSLTFSLEGSYNELLEETSPRATVSGTRRFSVGDGVNNFGVAASLDYFERDYAIYNIESGLWPLVDTPDGNQVRSPEVAEQRDYELSRERIGASVNFDYRTSEQSQYYLRTLYSRFADNEIELEHEYIFEDGAPISITEDRGIFESAAIEKRGKETTATRKITSILLGGENLASEWSLDYKLGWAEATTDEPFSLGTALVAEGLDIGYDVSRNRRTPLLFAQDLAAAENNDNYALELVELEQDKTEETEITLQFNVGRPIQYGQAPGWLKAGVQARLREKEDDANNRNFEDFDQDYTLSDLAGSSPRTDYSLGRFGPAVSTSRLRSFFAANGANFGVNEADFILDSFAEDFTFDEDIYSAYLMTEVTFGPMELLAGVRVEQTDVSQAGFRATVDENTNDGTPTLEAFAGENDYTDFFPNLQAVWRFSDQVHLRGALTRTMSRPSYVDSGARQIIEIEGEGDEIERNAEIGNPDLEPLYSNNFDLELTFYPGNLSVASIGVFYKDIEDFFVETDIAGQAPFDDFDSVSIVVNGPEAEVMGLELSYIQQFGFLPSPWDGLLMSANYTYVDSEADVLFRDTTIPLPQQADNIINLALGYEKYDLSMRLAANYRDDVFDGVEEPDDTTQDVYFDSELRVDFRAQYSFLENYTVLLNVLNLTDETFYAYYGDSRFHRQFDEFGLTVEAGLKVSFR